jgi:CBS domain-containing protein
MPLIPDTVAQVMTKDVVTVTEDQDLRELETAMRLLRFRHMPVVDGDKLVGIVSQRDVLRVTASSLMPNAQQQTQLLERRFHVRDLMTTRVRTVSPGSALVDVARIMQREKVGCLPVVDGRNVLVGIVTESDFVALAVQLLDRDAAFTKPPRSVGN